MENVKKQICRLCLGVIPAGMGVVIEETNKEKLEVLLINIDFDISDNAIACNKCLENLQDCFDFKSTCSYVDNYSASCMNVDMKIDINTEKEASKEGVNLENVQMCRLCMSLIKDGSINYNTDLKDDFFLKDMLRNCLLKVDLNTAYVPLICKRCLSSAKKYCEFMKTCHEVEERIKSYCQVGEGYGIRARVILEDVLEFKNCGTLSTPIVVKKECLDVENDDTTAMECFKGENTASIKCEEIDIKDELDIKAEISESVQSGNCNNSGMNGSSKTKKCAKTEKKQGSNSSQNVQECYLCSFVTNTRSLLNAHMMSHKGSTKAFRCHECSFETSCKSNLKQHFLKHKDKSEVELHKCPLCPYKSKYKNAVVQHRKVKHELNTKVYNCKDCPYITKGKRNFVRHELVHKNPGAVPIYKCQNCDYKNGFKSNLKDHMRIHSAEHLYKFRFNTSTKVFECLKCTYETDNKPQLVEHFLKHKWTVETYICPRCPFKSKCKYTVVEHWKLQHDKNSEVYKCKDCSYSIKQKIHFMRHQLVHKNPEEIPKHKCVKCEYETNYKSNLTLHMVVHEDLVKFKCEKCPYQCKRQADVKRHRVVHEDSAKFKCEKCPYQYKRKAEIKRHMMTHSSENLYSCEQCTYRSPFPDNLRHHMRAHQTDCKETTIRCDQCDFQTKYKTNLQRHKQRHGPTQPTFKCDKCDFYTINNSRLKNHQLKHMELGETMVYYCATCDYKTKYKHALSRHIRAKTCSNTKKENEDKEIIKDVVS